MKRGRECESVSVKGCGMGVCEGESEEVKRAGVEAWCMRVIWICSERSDPEVQKRDAFAPFPLERGTGPSAVCPLLVLLVFCAHGHPFLVAGD